MLSHCPNSKRGGFTLVEVLAAVAILSLVLTGVYGLWSGSLRAWRRGGEATEVFQRQRVVMETLAELAQSAVYFAASPDLYEVIGVRHPGLGDSVSFVTASDAFLPPSEASDVGMRRVTISMEQDDYRRTYLAIVNQPALSVTDDTKQELQAHVISMDVSGFFIRYLDPRDGAWYDKWEDANAIPAAMEFTVVFGQPGDQIPPVTVTRAIDLPVADFIARGTNPMLAPLSSTNEVQRRDVDSLGTLNTNVGQQRGQQGSPLPRGM
ncbi:MAG TPA: prepilin-type N-terminal cleavage/methylation domain-containing protein [Verrucomicrobiae bacterium]|nr:prepilin-type N-terminal cleavage/methylation domain-containing protein [Verrucomicrobiae bacterium]